MPEIPLRETDIMTRAKRILPYRDDFFGNTDIDGNPVSEEEIQQVILDVGAIASGIENMIFSHPSNPEKIHAVSYSHIEPERAKFIFYTHKLVSTLFPHNFPRIHAVFGSTANHHEDKPSYNSGTVRQKIERKEGKKIKYPLKTALRTLRELGLLPVIEDHPHNIIVSDGAEYYVEIIEKTISDFDVNKVIDYMEKESYSKTDKKTAERCLRKLFNIRKEIGSDSLNMVEATRMIALGHIQGGTPEFEEALKVIREIQNQVF